MAVVPIVAATGAVAAIVTDLDVAVIVVEGFVDGDADDGTSQHTSENGGFLVSEGVGRAGAEGENGESTNSEYYRFHGDLRVELRPLGRSRRRPYSFICQNFYSAITMRA